MLESKSDSASQALSGPFHSPSTGGGLWWTRWLTFQARGALASSPGDVVSFRIEVQPYSGGAVYRLSLSHFLCGLLLTQ